MSLTTRIVEVRENILKQNDLNARALRARFRGQGTFAVNMVSSPGAGKTALLETMLRTLRARHRVAALVGDLATDNDARRLARSGAPVHQILTGGICHLEAAMVEQALAALGDSAPEILFIENVGNLVCPASYDLGEQLRLVLFSVTEGDDKPLKYPTIFNSADAALITKIDLLRGEGIDFDLAAARANVRSVRPAMPVFEVSARTGDGMETWLEYLEARRAAFAQG